MGKKQSIHLTGSVLLWAIQESGLTNAEVASRVGVSQDDIDNWLEELDTPSKTQFNKLVSVLKRPSALFFLSEPPDIQPIQALFRNAPGSMDRRLESEEVRWIRQVSRIQEAAHWIMPQIELGQPKIPQRGYRDSPNSVAYEERNRLGISIEEQVRFANDRDAFRAWQASLEGLGIFVLQLSLGSTAGRGFAVWNEWAPMIAVNTAYHSYSGRIYTLIHEYAHLLTRTNDIHSTVEVSTTGTTDSVGERWCERFAANLLLPSEPLSAYIRVNLGFSKSKRITEPWIVGRIANRYKVSLRAVAIRLIELEFAPYELYDVVDKYAQTRERKKGGGGTGERKAKKRIRQYGSTLPRVFIDSVDQQVISRYDMMEYFDVTLAELEEMKESLTHS